MIYCLVEVLESFTVSLFRHLTSNISADDLKRGLSSRRSSAQLSVNMKLTALSLLLCLLSETILGTHDVVKVFVQEDSDAILPCSPSTKENLLGTLFDWIKVDGQRDVFMYEAGNITIRAEEFKGRVSHFTDEVKNGNASIIIRNTKIEDSGNYTCVHPRLEPEERFYIELVVGPVLKDRSGEIKGASPKPNIMIVNVTEDGVQLQCEVQGASPKPEVEFQDSAGNILPAEEPQVTQSGHRCTVIRLTTVTKTDRFRCVAKQKEIHHQTSAETYVTVYEKQFEDTHSKVDVTGWLFGGFFLGVFSVVAVLALLVATKSIKIQFIKGPCQQTKSSFDKPLTNPPESDTPLTSPV